MDKNIEEEETREALIDGLSFICQKLFSFFSHKKTNLMPVSQLLVTLALPQNKKDSEITTEDIFQATEKVIDTLDLMKKRSESNVH
jgi:hypothetical protein|tara:strand:+ start:194 stop:451 length:258 start_codon:yes stop_codon:yes gene_type:complete